MDGVRKQHGAYLVGPYLVFPTIKALGGYFCTCADKTNCDHIAAVKLEVRKAA